MTKKSAKSSKRGKVKAKGSVEVVEADDDANYTKRPRSKPRPQLYVVETGFSKSPPITETRMGRVAVKD